ncbi:hypothetical protein BCR43DRAFT_511753 [Syncephalastrum racemosum]|uniref:Uncharacterized protein n=1 Tax=Syncephalastrum racemosum TaxID=13706 RepID=A0A1X2HN99_SYNRA|nr:hypothetical protein BCR43DRAFT_511753 [Syncephalastrum racemosum]
MFFYSSLNQQQYRVDSVQGAVPLMAFDQTETSMAGWLFRPLYAMGYDLFLAMILFASCKTEFREDPAADAALSDDTTYDFVDDKTQVVEERRRYVESFTAKRMDPCTQEVQIPDYCRPSRASNWVSAIQRVFRRHIIPLLPAGKNTRAPSAPPVAPVSLAWTAFTYMKRFHRAYRYFWIAKAGTKTADNPIAALRLSYIKRNTTSEDYSCFPPEAAAAIRQALADFTGKYDEVTQDDVDEGFFGRANEYDIINKYEPEEDWPEELTYFRRDVYHDQLKKVSPLKRIRNACGW